MKVVISIAVLNLAITFGYASQCNVLECFHLGHEALQFKEGLDTDSCRKLKKTAQCFQACMTNTAANGSVQKGMSSLIEEMCFGDLAHRLQRRADCISKHAHELLACYLSFSHISPVSASPIPRHLECKKLLLVQKCTDFLNTVCSEEAMQVMDDIQRILLKEALISRCDGSTQGELDFDVLPFAEAELRNVSKCLFGNSRQLNACYTKHIKGSVTSVQKEALPCNAYNQFVDCLASHLGHICYSDSGSVQLLNKFFSTVLGLFEQNVCFDANDAQAISTESYVNHLETELSKTSGIAMSSPTTEFYGKEHEQQAAFTEMTHSIDLHVTVAHELINSSYSISPAAVSDHKLSSMSQSSCLFSFATCILPSFVVVITHLILSSVD